MDDVLTRGESLAVAAASGMLPMAADAPLKPLQVPYALVLFPVGFFRNGDGRLYIDPLWAKDLIEHTHYLSDLTLVSYAIDDKPPPPGAVAMESHPALRRVRCVLLTRPRSTLHALALLPSTVRVLWRELGRTAVVHSGFSWPIGEAWLLTPMMLLRRRFSIVNIESAAWRLVPGEKAGLKRRVRAAVTEWLNRFCCNRTDMCLFTQEGYKRSLLTRNPERGHVIEASWIDAETVLQDDEVAAHAQRRRDGADRALSMVFVGRMVEAKGVLLLVSAVSDLLDAGHRLELDLFGDGALAPALAELVARRGWGDRIRLRGAVPYDKDFFAALKGFDVMVVPSLADEQPRIVYDAYSQGLPVLASDTAGLRQCVEHGVTGMLFRVNDAAALKRGIAQLENDREALARFVPQAVTKARSLTHQEMHRRRWRLLTHALASAQAV